MIAAVKHAELSIVGKNLHQANVAILVVITDVSLSLFLFEGGFTLLFRNVAFWVNELTLIAELAVSHQVVLTEIAGLLLL